MRVSADQRGCFFFDKIDPEYPGKQDIKKAVIAEFKSLIKDRIG